jgi:hypothetical protein
MGDFAEPRLARGPQGHISKAVVLDASTSYDFSRWAYTRCFSACGRCSGGVIEGPRISGEVLSGGNDWQAVRVDGSTKFDVRLVLKTDDGALIVMNYQALRHGPPDIIEKLEKGEPVDAASYYFRMTASFETSSQKYDWMNRIVAVGTGGRPAGGPVYSLLEVL